jgi:hypothetical protein
VQIYKTSIGFVELSPLISLNIYAVGCKKRCKNCCNKQLQDFNHPKQKTLAYNELHDLLYTSASLCRAVCWLGGDVAYQPESYEKLSHLVARTNMYNCVFTGLELEELDKRILTYTNLLITGEWQGRPISDPRTNQKIFIRKYLATSDDPLGSSLVQIPYPLFKQRLKEI